MNMMNDGNFVSETHGQQNNGDMEKNEVVAFAAKAKAAVATASSTKYGCGGDDAMANKD